MVRESDPVLGPGAIGECEQRSVPESAPLADVTEETYVANVITDGMVKWNFGRAAPAGRDLLTITEP